MDFIVIPLASIKLSWWRQSEIKTGSEEPESSGDGSSGAVPTAPPRAYRGGLKKIPFFTCPYANVNLPDVVQNRQKLQTWNTKEMKKQWERDKED